MRGAKTLTLSLPYAPAVRLDAASAASDDDAPVWIQVAEAGRYLGHWQGPFELTRATFDALVRNFRAHPAFRKGPDGWGCADLVGYDFHHASEADPTRGDIAVVGAPAQAWALDLDVRTGTDGKAELWALTRYLEPARSYVREGRYRWTSIAIRFDAVDIVTGESIGPVLTSIAFTNQPAAQTLSPITATYRPDPYDRPSTAADVLCALREVFELPATAGLGEVIGEIGKLRAWSASGGAPVGVDVGELIGSLRLVFNLPALASAGDVLAEADKLLARLAEEQAAAPSTAAPAAPEPTAALVTASAQPILETTPMTTPATPTAPDIKSLLAQRLDLKPDEANETRLVLAVEQGQEARRLLASLLEALGAPTAQVAAAKVAELMKAAATLETLAPEHASMKKRLAEVDEHDAEAEVDAALLAHAMPASAKKSMLLHRKSDVEDFRKTYPLPDPRHAHLSQPMYTPPPKPPPSSPLDRIQAGAGGLRLKPPIQPPPAIGSGAGPVNLSAFAGANNVERAMAMLRAQGDKRPFHELHAAACDLARANPAS